MKQKIFSLLALLITAVGGAWAQDTYTVTFKANGNTKTVENVTLPHTFELDPIIIELYPSLSGGNGSPAGTSASGNTNVTAYHNNSKHYATISAPFEGAVTVTGQFYKDFSNHQYTLEINCMEELVAISDDKTEASFTMPAYDVTVDYELVRDMASNMPVTVGDGTDGYRIRLKKDGESFVPAEMTPQQMAGLIAVTDGIESKTLTNMTDYTISIYAVNDEDKPTGEAITFQSLTPGRYVAIATAVDGTIYDGETEPSNIFVLFQGYEVEVAAQSFITYYKDEALTLDADETAAELYTISSVSADEAVLSAQIGVAPANTPLLVYNSGSEKKTILLIPTDDQADNVTAYSGFKGTLVASTFTAADMQANDYYALSGGQYFVPVLTAGTIAAHKCWLQFPKQQTPGSRKLTIVFEGNGTTGVSEELRVKSEEFATATWYDLNGRKLNAAPTQKGVYILNGKKVVIK